ncbi:MAG TPA: hypothetical protein DDZ96_13520 [Porphyromonadaceae bacterium]|mgnify:CR=1 FL=1|jgi:hypothetical protein|uniref:hypothetical protein n=1 Tax=Limibacterium fermenti TaxID=3229863 RepID=UPI000E9D57E1|nr:hypothetical protein [Porphyromonadaceae bacterium]HBK31862.1 hypothetical protein [Porphyromonadaceae bacterium]HBL34814.1 hypothetical protein [Porphyromonadaceae bacterium]HBX20545.1 hypothetical protein [Porphyromonadaceae bacterium]HBX45780.1 hypothetical protein [Porphyromonadaceae bacterium]
MTDKQFLIEAITKDLIEYLMEDYRLSLPEAFHKLYHSDTYSKLLDERSGLYLQSSGYVYDFLHHEIKTGKTG